MYSKKVHVCKISLYQVIYNRTYTVEREINNIEPLTTQIRNVIIKPYVLDFVSQVSKE